MTDVLFVAATVAFFALASGLVNLCDRVLRGGTPAPSGARPSDRSGVGADPYAAVDVTGSKGVRAG